MNDIRDRMEKYEQPKLQTTPMIDVVFLLLIFFIVTSRPVDVLSKLDVSRPAPSEDIQRIPLLRAEVLPGGGYVLNGRKLDLPGLDQVLTRFAGLSKQTGIVVVCDPASRHTGLMQVLDLCAKLGFDDVAVMSR
jgi:biopolymer transport protein ExbD